MTRLLTATATLPLMTVCHTLLSILGNSPHHLCFVGEEPDSRDPPLLAQSHSPEGAWGSFKLCQKPLDGTRAHDCYCQYGLAHLCANALA